MRGTANDGWQVVRRVRNPWGQVPLTDGGRALPPGARDYVSRLRATSAARDPAAKRHHYVPRSYLREWSFDTKRVWTLDTVSGSVAALGLRDVCVAENFYRVIGSDGQPHNRVESLFGVVDQELRRVQSLFDSLSDPEELEYDDLVGLAVSMAVQSMRTPQKRRLQVQYSIWLEAQNPDEFMSFDGGDADPHRSAGLHTQLLFEGMWEAADALTTRQIEIWDDPQGRFLTCDAPVLVPFDRNASPGLLASPWVIWPVSPRRAVALTNEHVGEKAVILSATGKRRGLVRQAIYDGRERQIFASEDQRDRLPATKQFRRRTQVRLRCSDHGPDGTPILPPGCCVEYRECLAIEPDLCLCSQGLHREAPGMGRYA